MGRIGQACHGFSSRWIPFFMVLLAVNVALARP